VIINLRQLFDVAYHASLLRDEDRQVIFRIMFGDPALLPPEDGPPSGLMPLHLDRPRPYNEQEIQRLSMAALFFSIDDRRLLERGSRLGNLGNGCFGNTVAKQSCGRALSRGARAGFSGHPFTRPGPVDDSFRTKPDCDTHGGIVESKAFDLFESKWLQGVFAQYERFF